MILANGNFVADYTKLVQAALVVMRSRHNIAKAMHGHGLVIYVWAACLYEVLVFIGCLQMNLLRWLRGMPSLQIAHLGSSQPVGTCFWLCPATVLWCTGEDPWQNGIEYSAGKTGLRRGFVLLGELLGLRRLKYLLLLMALSFFHSRFVGVQRPSYQTQGHGSVVYS